MKNLEIGITATSNVAEATGKAGKEVDKLAAKLKKAFDFKGAITDSLIGVFGAAALLDKAINLITDSFREMGDIADKSAKAGVSGEEFDKLSFAASEAGVSTQTLSSAIRQLRINLKDAITDTVKMKQFTEGLGFAEEDVRNGKVKTIDVITRLSLVISQQENEQTKLALATAFLSDKFGTELLPVLEKIGKDPNIFEGLITGSQEAYEKLDKTGDKVDKLYHNVKRLFGLNFSNMLDFGEFLNKHPVLSTILKINPLTSGAAIGATALDDLANGGNNNKTTAGEASKIKYNTDAILAGANKSKANDNTIANSLGASMGNGPTGAVIGVGNNASFSILVDQLDTLKQIRDGIANLAPSQTTQTDFTKQGTTED